MMRTLRSLSSLQEQSELDAGAHVQHEPHDQHPPGGGIERAGHRHATDSVGMPQQWASQRSGLTALRHPPPL